MNLGLGADTSGDRACERRRDSAVLKWGGGYFMSLLLFIHTWQVTSGKGITKFPRVLKELLSFLVC